MNLEYFVESLVKELGADAMAMENENMFSIHLGEYVFFIAYKAAHKSILLHASVGVHNNKPEALAYLLTMNTFFAKNHGVCLGIDDAVITAQQIIFVTDVENELTFMPSFMEQCSHFLKAIFLLLQYFDNEKQFYEDITKNTAEVNAGQESCANVGIRV